MPTYLPPRRGISHSAAVAEARAFARVDEPELITLAFYHSAFVDSLGAQIALYVVNDFEALQATIEAGAPLDAGEEVTFQPVPMRVVFPEESDDNRNPGASIEISNVLRALSPHLRAAAGTMEPVRMIVRTYLPSDTSAPHEMPPLSLELTGAETDGVNVRFGASYGDVANFPFPAVSYTAEGFPALAAAGVT
jgi:hypothetical protein